MEIDREEFENPYRPEGYSYTVIDCQKKCHSVEYRTMTNFRRKIASLQTAQGFTRYYYTGEFTFDDEISISSVGKSFGNGGNCMYFVFICIHLLLSPACYGIREIPGRKISNVVVFTKE